MRLLRLEISGFKSFCDKTVLSFIQDGISVVVGPNGCGKSNLVDAVRWTLGEQSAKHLRGGSMEDVIFNGSSVRQPVSMAQVTLVFSNPEHDTIPKYAEFSEISATRRLYRSGESQYLINKTACRLTDIRELFMDTGIGSKGYSIIEQGKIDQIVTSRAEDRRSIIDEAAGIVKFKVKRKEAERKFAASKQNLLRVEDIIAELNRQEETLREQVAQAEIYIHTKARLERLQQCTAATRWFYLKEDINKITASLQKNQLSSEELTTSIATLDVQNASRQLELSTKEAEQEDLRRTIQTHKEGIIKLESKLETDRVAIENLDEWQKKGLEENELISRQIKTIEFQIVSYKKDSENFEKKAAEITIQLNRLLEFEKVKERELVDKRSNLEKNQSEELQMVKRMNDDQNQLKQSRERLEEINQGEISTRSQLDQAQAESLHLDGHLELALKSLDEKRAAKHLCGDRIESIEAVIEDLAQQVKAYRDKLQELTQSLNQAENRYHSLQELIHSHEVYDSATKVFLDYLDNHPLQAEKIGFEGTLAELVAPPEETMPQTTAFLNRYFNLLVFSSVNQLQDIVEIVNQLEVEQLQLFFIDLIEPAHTGENGDNRRWIQSKSDPSVSVPLADSFQLVDLPLFKLSPKTLLGSNGLIDPDAAIMTRAKIFLLGKPGKANQAELFFKRQEELTTLEKNQVQFTKDLQITGDRLNQVLLVRNEHEQNLARYRKEMIDLDLEILSAEKGLDAKTLEKNRLLSHQKLLLEQREQFQKSRTTFEEKIAGLSLTDAENQEKHGAIQAEIQQLKSLIDTVKLDKQEYTEELQVLKINLASLEEKKKNNLLMQERLEEDLQQRKDQQAEIQLRFLETKDKKELIRSSLTESNDALPKQLKLLSDVETQLKKVNDKIETDRIRFAEIQASITREQKKKANLMEKNHKLDIRLAQLTQEAKNIADNLYAENQIAPDELIETFDVRQFDIEAEAEAMVLLKGAIGRMDDVNLAAKKEYDTLKERLDFLITQSADLEQSINALEDSISKINQESRRRFREAFNQINQQFSKIFPQLFGGGEAYLELTDDADLLESGVEIIARPPGKRLQNMTLLSGGEKALTAIALVFSVFMIKPSPFCLLDEVDAPLDEANNERFNRHVKLLTQNSQFVIITHNKKTMEIGDALFGVTMEEPGISKVVSVDFNSFDMATEPEIALVGGS
ncbi:MAG: chromosome segregation protein SMC [Deltaproteobacteria bacterium]|nr:chromosome segregation protein SMC [Deltaproteobacteria bacterium]